MDIITDFAGNENILDIRDILIGYDPRTSVIADFVQFSAVGRDTIMNIDRDGTEATYSATQIANLLGVSIAPDPDALLNTLHLLV